mmetsp:Transcript_6078/g.7287  ORF Transcript_6078/g.7287 Transcript_6078/m.7287 type:complete len:123 (+) Transcript_6078:534-902(+)
MSHLLDLLLLLLLQVKFLLPLLDSFALLSALHDALNDVETGAVGVLGSYLVKLSSLLVVVASVGLALRPVEFFVGVIHLAPALLHPFHDLLRVQFGVLQFKLAPCLLAEENERTEGTLWRRL